MLTRGVLTRALLSRVILHPHPDRACRIGAAMIDHA